MVVVVRVVVVAVVMAVVALAVVVATVISSDVSVVTLDVSGCVVFEVVLVVPRVVRAHTLRPLPECVPTVVEYSQGWFQYAGWVEARLRVGFNIVALATAGETVASVVK